MAICTLLLTDNVVVGSSFVDSAIEVLLIGDLFKLDIIGSICLLHTIFNRLQDDFLTIFDNWLSILICCHQFEGEFSSL